MAKLLASAAAWEAADVAMTTFGGSGMAVEVGIERKFREARLYLVAPVTNNLVTAYVAEHFLRLPRSYDRGGSASPTTTTAPSPNISRLATSLPTPSSHPSAR